MVIFYWHILYLSLSSFSAYRNLAKTDHDHTENIVLGFFNIAQWLIATAFPVLLVINTSHTTCIHVTITKSGHYCHS